MIEFIMSSPVNVIGTKNKDSVTLIYQFFIHEDKKRNEEIRQCLKRNVENEYIDKIILLNEKKYTDDELGIKHKKIRQVNINKRLTYKDVFNCVQGDRLNGYIICCNADIFFDDTLQNIFNSELHAKKQVLMPLRFDYNDKGKIKYKLFILITRGWCISIKLAIVYFRLIGLIFTYKCLYFFFLKGFCD